MSRIAFIFTLRDLLARVSRDILKSCGLKVIRRRPFPLSFLRAALSVPPYIEGYNGRLDAIQAGFLRAKLRHLKKWNGQRQEIAHRYNTLLAGSDGGVTLPHQPEWSRSVYHLYILRVADRVQLQKRLDEAGVSTGIHYPIALHLAKAYEGLGFRPGDFPVAEKAASEVLSLPMFPELTSRQQDRVVAAVLKSITVSHSSGSRLGNP